MISQTAKPKTSRRSTEGKQSKKPRVTSSDECPPPILVDEHVKPITIESTIDTECDKPSVEEHALLELVEPVDTEPQEQEHSHIIEPTKVLCCCGSVIVAKSLAKHEKTKKHLAFLESQDATTLVV
jgi:hypothetical protein